MKGQVTKLSRRGLEGIHGSNFNHLQMRTSRVRGRVGLGPGCCPVVSSQESEGAHACSWLLSTEACCAGREDKLMAAVRQISGSLTFSSCSYQTREARFLSCHVTSITSPTFAVCHVKSLLFMMSFLDTIHSVQASDESASAPTPSILLQVPFQQAETPMFAHTRLPLSC